MFHFSKPPGDVVDRYRADYYKVNSPLTKQIVITPMLDMVQAGEGWTDSCIDYNISSTTGQLRRI